MQIGTTTNADGRFLLSVPSANVELVFSFVGYATQTVKAGSRTVFEIVLEEMVSDLSDVVVVGYGTQKKVNLTGAVSSVDYSKEAGSRPLVDATQALAGLAPGLQVMQGTGNPYAENYSVNIRGIGTLNNSAPLVLVDGMEQSIGNVNPMDIESVSILKDAASSAIYGNRGANGVILITTKTGGKKDRMNVDVSAKMSHNSALRIPQLISNYADYMELINESYTNLGRNAAFTDGTINLWREKEKDPNGSGVRAPNMWLIQIQIGMAQFIMPVDEIIPFRYPEQRPSLVIVSLLVMLITLAFWRTPVSKDILPVLIFTPM